MTGKPFPVTYKVETESIEGAPSYLTFLARYVPVFEKKVDTGRVVLDFLPVRFSGAGREVAEASAIAFWDAETARKQAKKEHGRKLALRNKA